MSFKKASSSKYVLDEISNESVRVVGVRVLGNLNKSMTVNFNHAIIGCFFVFPKVSQ